MDDDNAWKPLRNADLSEEINTQIRSEYPDLAILRTFMAGKYRLQNGMYDDEDVDCDHFRRWLAYQRIESEISHPFRKWPRLEAMYYDTFSDKASVVAQRHCRLCRDPEGRDLMSSFFAIRITPISRQVKNGAVFKAYQRALAARLSRTPWALGPGDRLCLAITFILNRSRRDKDLDNMAKALQDAIARALGFDDKHVHHLDVLKLIFGDTDEYVCVNVSSSSLNDHQDVLVAKTSHNWAGQAAIQIEDYMQASLK